MKTLIPIYRLLGFHNHKQFILFFQQSNQPFLKKNSQKENSQKENSQKENSQKENQDNIRKVPPNCS